MVANVNVKPIPLEEYVTNAKQTRTILAVQIILDAGHVYVKLMAQSVQILHVMSFLVNVTVKVELRVARVTCASRDILALIGTMLKDVNHANAMH